MTNREVITTDTHAEFCNSKWTEANRLYSDSWKCYLELARELRELKEGELKGRFKQWCKSELEFSYDWACMIMRAYNRYELSGFKDGPQKSIEAYARGKVESTQPDAFEQLADAGELTLANLLTVQTPMTKSEQRVNDWIDKNPGRYDEIDKEILSKVLPMLKAMVKKHGPVVILHAQEILAMIKSKDI